jgi:tetratricopeptide (TPR) repeat protein
MAVKAILARIDGTLDTSDIAALTNLPEEAVARVVTSLVAGGLLAEEGVPLPTATLSPPPGIARSLVPPGLVAAEAPSPVEGTLKISDDEVRRVSELHEKLNRIDHYRLLGVAATADGKDIKRAYLALAKLHHPDRFLRKDVGALRPKIDAVFAAMTLALETLTDVARRQEYDAYLREVLRTRLLRRSAETYEQKGDWQAACEHWERVVEQLPTDAYLQHRYAYALLQGNADLGHAVSVVTRAIQLDPKRAEYRVTAACLYLATGRERNALLELDVACDLEPDRRDYAGLRAAVTERARGLRGTGAAT